MKLPWLLPWLQKQQLSFSLTGVALMTDEIPFILALQIPTINPIYILQKIYLGPLPTIFTSWTQDQSGFLQCDFRNQLLKPIWNQRNLTAIEKLQSKQLSPWDTFIATISATFSIFSSVFFCTIRLSTLHITCTFGSKEICSLFRMSGQISLS